MTEPTHDVLAPLRDWRPTGDSTTSLEGGVDVHRSDGRHLYFSARPERGPWIRVPAGAVADLRVLGEIRCGPVVWPHVRMVLDPADPSTPTVMDAVRASVRAGGAPGGPGSGALLPGTGEEEGAGTHDVRVEIRPEGKLYRIRLHVEGHEVRDVSWDAEQKVYTGEVPGLPVEDALDVDLQAWGTTGASLTCSVQVDGRALEPALVVRVAEGPGRGRRSYRL